MTATQVDGVAVITSEPAESGISTPTKPVFFKQILRLLLEDGREVYGCIHCDFTRPSAMAVRPHLKAHSNGSDDGPKPKPKKKIPAPSDMSLSELLARVSDLEKITAERDEWKRRAMKAERELATVRRVLKP